MVLLSRPVPKRNTGRWASTTRATLKSGANTAWSRCAKRRETIPQGEPVQHRESPARKLERRRHKDHPALARGRPLGGPDGPKDLALPRARPGSGRRGERRRRGDHPGASPAPRRDLDGRRDAGHGRDLGHRRVALGRLAERGGDPYPLRRRRNEDAGAGSRRGGVRRQAPNGRDAAGGDPASGSGPRKAETTRASGRAARRKRGVMQVGSRSLIEVYEAGERSTLVAKDFPGRPPRRARRAGRKLLPPHLPGAPFSGRRGGYS